MDITSPYNKITYEFDSRSNLDKYFLMNKDTGAIKLQNPIRNKKNIPLTVIAKDDAMDIIKTLQTRIVFMSTLK